MEKHIKSSMAHKRLFYFYTFMICVASLTFVLPSDNITTINTRNLLIGLIFYAAIAALHYYVSKAALEKKQWARNTSKVLGLFLLLAFPIGTIAGIYLLVNLWDTEKKSRIF